MPDIPVSFLVSPLILLSLFKKLLELRDKLMKLPVSFFLSFFLSSFCFERGINKCSHLTQKTKKVKKEVSKP